MSVSLRSGCSPAATVRRSAPCGAGQGAAPCAGFGAGLIAAAAVAAPVVSEPLGSSSPQAVRPIAATASTPTMLASARTRPRIDRVMSGLLSRGQGAVADLAGNGGESIEREGAVDYGRSRIGYGHGGPSRAGRSRWGASVRRRAAEASSLVASASAATAAMWPTAAARRTRRDGGTRTTRAPAANPRARPRRRTARRRA